MMPQNLYLRIFLISLLSFLFSLSLLSSAAAKSPGQLIGDAEVIIPDWFKTSFLDFREDAEEAADDDRHLLIYFHIHGCPYCQKMLDDNFRGEANKALVQASFDSVELNMHGSREVVFDQDKTLSEAKLTKALGVRYTPTILFMNAKNQIVMRLNGYRSPREFRQVLNYVSEKAYLESDFPSYRDKNISKAIYELKPHKMYKRTRNLQQLIAKGGPVAILFEDSSCDACEIFHKEVFNVPEIQKELSDYTVVRLDAADTSQIIDDLGNKTSPKAWLAKLGISYRPAMLLFNEGKSRERVTGLLKSFHYQQLLQYVSAKHYTRFSSWSLYMTHRLKALIESGETVNVWK